MIFNIRKKACLKLGRRFVRVSLFGSGHQKELRRTFTLDKDEEEFSLETLKELLDCAADWVEQTVPARKPVEISWVLSDPWVHQRIFQVDRLPGGHKATDALVHWRFGQELGQAADEFRVAWQLRPNAGSSSALYCAGLDADWYEALCQPWLKRRWPVTSMVTLVQSPETSQNNLALDESPFTVILTDEYWLTWRSSPETTSGVRCRWFAEDPDSEALLRDIARAVNEEGLGKVRVFGSDTAPGMCRRITSRFAESMAEGYLTVADLHHRQEATITPPRFGLVPAKKGGQG